MARRFKNPRYTGDRRGGAGVSSAAGKTMVSRRSVLKTLSAIPLVGLVGAGCTPTVRGYGGEPRPLPIPPLAQTEMRDGVEWSAIEAQAGMTNILPDVQTPTWGFNGTFLGPTLRFTRRHKIGVQVTNSLDEMTTVHWHGMIVPGECDGGPHLPIEPGETWEPSWEIENHASTLWYHPHPHGVTGLHAYRGLAGMIIIDDDNPAAEKLPHDYGVDDIPLVLTDIRFNEDGTRDETDLPDLGLLGDVPLVNGITNAHFDAPRRRVRFRILDGSTMRMFNLELSGKKQFTVIASEGGYLNNPLPVERIPMSPGERVEVVVDLEPGEKVTLKATPFPDKLDVPDDEGTPDFGLKDAFTLLTITGPAEDAPVPGDLPRDMNPSAEEIPDLSGAPTREFGLKGFRINDEVMDMQRVDFTVDHDHWEVWTFSNYDTDWLHNMHVHDTQFRILSLKNTKSLVMTRGWKDTILLPPNAYAKVAVRFTNKYTSTRWPYMYHCHMLYHEDMGMMGQFLVTKPGELPDSVMGNGDQGNSKDAARTGQSDYARHRH